MTAAASFLWAALVALGLLLEGFTLSSGAGTFSATVRAVLGTEPGKLLLYPFWTWLSYHLFLAPSVTPTWRDVIPLALGLGLALLRIHLNA